MENDKKKKENIIQGKGIPDDYCIVCRDFAEPDCYRGIHKTKTKK